MSSARSDLFIYIGVALATTIGLFVLHYWYASFLDVRYHSQLETGGPSEALLAAREEDEKLLQAGKLPLAQAMSAVAKADTGARPASIAPAPSQDISAVSGWIHARGFKPVTAHPVRTAKAAPAPAQAAEVAPAETAPAETAPAAPTPAAAPQLRLKTEVLKPQMAR